jgi:hypothetical protein
MYFGGIYKNLKEEYIFEALRKEVADNELPFVVLEVLQEAIESEFWIELGYDGATFIQDKYHPRLANFLHDYFWRTGAGGKESDVIFRELLILTGDSKFSAKVKYNSVRTAWFLKFKRKHKRNNNVRNLTDNEKNLYLLLKD